MSSEVVQKLVRYFFNSLLNFNLEPEEVNELTWKNQEVFLNSTVKTELLRKYPVSREFCRLFFKRLINNLEPYQEIHDECYNCLCDVLSNTNKEDFHYKHYVVGNNIENNNIITLKETKNMVVNGTTGMRTWQAALMLADYAISHKSQFKQKNIVELGAGVGFTGIAIAKFCDIKSIVLTDCHEDVLKALSDNISINFSDCTRAEHDMKIFFEVHDKIVSVLPLDWNSAKDVANDLAPDVIIGADIIYDPSILKPLCKVVRTFFERNKNLTVYFANVIRNQETYRKFLDLLGAVKLKWELISHTDSTFIEWDTAIDSCLLKIKL